MFLDIPCVLGGECDEEEIDPKEEDIPENGKFHNSRCLQNGWFLTRKGKEKELDALWLWLPLYPKVLYETGRRWPSMRFLSLHLTSYWFQSPDLCIWIVSQLRHVDEHRSSSLFTSPKTVSGLLALLPCRYADWHVQDNSNVILLSDCCGLMFTLFVSAVSIL